MLRQEKIPTTNKVTDKPHKLTTHNRCHQIEKANDLDIAEISTNQKLPISILFDWRC